MTISRAPILSQSTSIRWPIRLSKILLFSWAFALAAHIRLAVPWSPVPVTAQTFTVMIAALALTPTDAFTAVCAYLLQGAIGLPVFAGASSGVNALIGPTGGYLLAMPVAALAASWINRRRPGTFLVRVTSCCLCASLVLMLGCLGLMRYIHGATAVLWAGLYPFVPGEAMKCLAAATAFSGTLRIKSLWIVRRTKRSTK